MAERLKHFLESWRIIKKYKEILSFVESFQILLLQESSQEKVIAIPDMNSEEKRETELEVKCMLGKGVISACQD